MDNNLHILTYAAQEAGRYLKANFSRLKEQKLKEGTHYESVDDHVVDDVYHKILQTTKIPICSEESMLSSLPDEYWLIDPIEGTTNYTHANPFFATQACLIQENKVVCSVVYAPIFDQLYIAEKGKGTTLNGQIIRIGNIDEVKKGIVSPNKGTGEENLAWWGKSIANIAPKVRTIRLFGAVGLELAYVAAGFLDAHYNRGCHPYDDAPGSLLVQEAGGAVINFNGDGWSASDSSIIAGNEKIVRELTQLIAKI